MNKMIEKAGDERTRKKIRDKKMTEKIYRDRTMIGDRRRWKNERKQEIEE